MPPSKHAMLGASGAHRWLACPPSAMWETSFPETGSSEAAAEGTLAHAIAETHLRQRLEGNGIATPLQFQADPLYKAAMEEYVGVYEDYVLAALTEAQQTTPDARLVLEQKVDFTDWVPDGWGTADAVLISDDLLQVFDLKYGKGVPVDAVGNPQIRLYALGAYLDYQNLYDIKKIRVHIIQPRLDSISSEDLTVEALLAWADKEVKPRAQEAAAGKGAFKAGDHCRFCRCKNVCRTYAEKQLELARIAFTETGEERSPNELSPAEIGDILSRVDELTRWAKSVKDWALDQATSGEMVFPGWKIVAGRSNRIITDKTAAAELLEKAGFVPSDLYELKTLTALEEVAGKKKLGEILGELIVKPDGKPVLAPESDKRPAINSAASVFTKIDE